MGTSSFSATKTGVIQSNPISLIAQPCQDQNETVLRSLITQSYAFRLATFNWITFLNISKIADIHTSCNFNTNSRNLASIFTFLLWTLHTHHGNSSLFVSHLKISPLQTQSNSDFFRCRFPHPFYTSLFMTSQWKHVLRASSFRSLNAHLSFSWRYFTSVLLVLFQLFCDTFRFVFFAIRGMYITQKSEIVTRNLNTDKTS